MVGSILLVIVSDNTFQSVLFYAFFVFGEHLFLQKRIAHVTVILDLIPQQFQPLLEIGKRIAKWVVHETVVTTIKPTVCN